MEPIESARDLLLFELNSAERAICETTTDITDVEYNWEPVAISEQPADLLLPPECKRVWRIYSRELDLLINITGSVLVINTGPGALAFCGYSDD